VPKVYQPYGTLHRDDGKGIVLRVAAPVNTLNTVAPLGMTSLDHAVEPPDVNNNSVPLVNCTDG
jgi:hypothetical protein